MAAPRRRRSAAPAGGNMKVSMPPMIPPTTAPVSEAEETSFLVCTLPCLSLTITAVSLIFSAPAFSTWRRLAMAFPANSSSSNVITAS